MTLDRTHVTLILGWLAGAWSTVVIATVGENRSVIASESLVYDGIIVAALVLICLVIYAAVNMLVRKLEM